MGADDVVQMLNQYEGTGDFPSMQSQLFAVLELFHANDSAGMLRFFQAMHGSLERNGDQNVTQETQDRLDEISAVADHYLDCNDMVEAYDRMRTQPQIGKIRSFYRTSTGHI